MFATGILFLFCFCLVVRSDLYGCSEQVTCKTCISHNPCGWCETNILYADGTLGPQCAGKPQDPKNPPAGYRPWTCPSNFQNLYCPSYKCNNKTYQCDATNKGDGVSWDQCFSNCLPPVYSCNKTDAKCYLTAPGLGVDKTSCEKMCVDALYECDKANYQCKAVKTGGKPFGDCLKGCFPPTYNCSESNKTCFVVPPGFGTDLNTCKSTCGKSKAPSKTTPSAPVAPQFFNCNETDFTCYQVPNGQTKAACLASCGNPANVTPVHLIGVYRGLQINRGYLKGEWTLQITDAVTVIKDPSNKVWAQGTVATYEGELWLVTGKGKYRGISSASTLPEVFALTWAFGALNGNAPDSFDTAMKTGSVFTFKKCLNNAICKWNSNNILNHEEAIKEVEAADNERSRHVRKHSVDENERKVVSKKTGPINDPCSVFDNCQSCIDSLHYCGWCSTNVLYNATTPGTQCAGLNQSRVPGFLCKGSFSTVDCPVPPSGPPPTTAPPTTIPPLKPTSPIKPPPPTAPVDLYVCNPSTSTCEKNNTGSGRMPYDQCNLTCNFIPDVPVVLRGRKFRGLQIQTGYLPGEYTVKFSTTSATFTNPKGVVLEALVSQTGQYMVLNLASGGGRIFTIWQIGPDSVVDFLSWSWGALNGPAPLSFDASMVTPGQTSYVFDGCSTLSTVCNFAQ